MANTKTKKGITIQWLINYFAVLSLEVYFILELWLDDVGPKEGPSYVMWNIVGNLLLAYLTSWFFLHVINYKEKKETKAFVKVHLEGIFRSYGDFIFNTFWRVVEIEKEPINAVIWSKTILPALDKQLTTAADQFFWEYPLKMAITGLSSNRRTNKRHVRSIKEKRSTLDDELVSLLNGLVYSLTGMQSKKSELGKISVGQIVLCLHMYFKRVAELEAYCIRQKLIAPDAVSKEVRRHWDMQHKIVLDDVQRRPRFTVPELVSTDLDFINYWRHNDEVKTYDQWIAQQAKRPTLGY